MELVVSLACSAETVAARIESNAGRDRTGRVDDQAELIKKKMRFFKERTTPLIEFYRSTGALIIELDVDPSSDGGALYQKLISRMPPQ